MLVGINFAIDLEDNPFCDHLVLGFLLSEVRMNGSVEGKKGGQRTGPVGEAPLSATHRGSRASL